MYICIYIYICRKTNFYGGGGGEGGGGVELKCRNIGHQSWSTT